MEILLCNDDGYYSKGIKALESAFSDIANLTIVAPETNCSGASSSLTIKNPLRIRKFQDNGYYVNGTPCDCIHLAATTICHRRPDLIISGINLGANLGDDVLYSGTVGAAMGDVQDQQLTVLYDIRDKTEEGNRHHKKTADNTGGLQ